MAGVFDDWSSTTRKVLKHITLDDSTLDAFDKQTIRPRLGAAHEFAKNGAIAAIGLAGQELAMLSG